VLTRDVERRENSIKLYIEISKPYIDFVKSYINLPWNRRSQSKLECSICFGIDAGCSITFLCGHAGFTFVHTGLPKNRESCVYECKPVCSHRIFGKILCVCVQLRYRFGHTDTQACILTLFYLCVSVFVFS
jgi:hypothetical protein